VQERFNSSTDMSFKLLGHRKSGEVCKKTKEKRVKRWLEAATTEFDTAEDGVMDLGC
jgi:hypothetical protein